MLSSQPQWIDIRNPRTIDFVGGRITVRQPKLTLVMKFVSTKYICNCLFKLRPLILILTLNHKPQNFLYTLSQCNLTWLFKSYAEMLYQNSMYRSYELGKAFTVKVNMMDFGIVRNWNNAFELILSKLSYLTQPNMLWWWSIFLVFPIILFERNRSPSSRIFVWRYGLDIFPPI